MEINTQTNGFLPENTRYANKPKEKVHDKSNEQADFYDAQSYGTFDAKAVRAAIAEARDHTDSLKKLVASLVSKQSGRAAVAGSQGVSINININIGGEGGRVRGDYTVRHNKEAGGINWRGVELTKKTFENLKVDEKTVADAKSDISEKGYYGVEATSKRILDFAKAISGGDASKIGLLRDAVEKGFAAAEKAWGDKLPDITQKTHEAVMKGFDDWTSKAVTDFTKDTLTGQNVAQTVAGALQ
ncbi:hypothetical protein AGMMS49975_11210 [Clostridia bacterium]|nr:hypothetical protein AGMMS49975_11210 [Clostridia bacterium]